MGTPLQGLPSPVPLTRTRPHPPKPQVPKPSPVGGGRSQTLRFKENPPRIQSSQTPVAPQPFRFPPGSRERGDTSARTADGTGSARTEAPAPSSPGSPRPPPSTAAGPALSLAFWSPGDSCPLSPRPPTPDPRGSSVPSWDPVRLHPVRYGFPGGVQLRRMHPLSSYILLIVMFCFGISFTVSFVSLLRFLILVCLLCP